MADGNVQWVFELFDRVTGPVNKMERAMERLEKSMERQEKVTKKAKQAHESLGLKMTEYVTIARAAYDATSKIVGKLFSFAKESVAAIGFRQNMMLAFEAATGSVEGARRAFALAESFARQMGLPMEEVAGWTKELTGAGLEWQDMVAIMKAAGDVTVFENSVEKGTQFINMMKNLAQSGTVVSKVFGSFNDVGVSSEKIYENLSKTLKIAGSTVGEIKKNLRLGGQEVPAMDALAAVTKAVADTSGGKLGAFAKRHAATFEGLSNNIGSSATALKAFMAAGEGGKALAGVMANLARLMSPNSGFSKLLREFVDGPLAKFLNLFTGKDGLERITAGFRGLSEVLGGLYETTKALISILAPFARLVGGAYKLGAGMADEAGAEAGRKAYLQIHPMNGPAEAPPPSAPISPSERGGGAMKRGTSMNMPVEIHIHGNADEKTVDEMKDALSSFFDRMAMEQGVA